MEAEHNFAVRPSVDCIAPEHNLAVRSSAAVYNLVMPSVYYIELADCTVAVHSFAVHNSAASADYTAVEHNPADHMPAAVHNLVADHMPAAVHNLADYNPDCYSSVDYYPFRNPPLSKSLIKLLCTEKHESSVLYYINLCSIRMN